MTELELQALRGAGFVAAVAIAVLAQRVIPHGRLTGSSRVNWPLWGLNLVVTGAVCGACGFSVARWAGHAGVGFLHWAAVGPWAAILASAVGLDLVSYAWHRANHRIAPLWRFHQVHHSDPTFTVSTGVRFHPGELLLALPVRLVAIAVLGAPVAAVVVFEMVFTMANLIEHGDIDLPRGVEDRLAWVCITPALHRRHHTRVRPDRDLNFGTIFSVWDRLFGSYGENHSRIRVQTGLPGIDEVRFADALSMPFRRRLE